VTGVVFFIGHQWLLGATAKEKCEHRNENYEKNLHTRFLPMHGTGSSGKWQVANGEIHESPASIRDSDICFTKMRQDSTPWRLGMLGATLEAVRKEWPQAAKWPVAFAAMSGGAKRNGVLGAMLARAGSVNICGFYLSGINDDRLSPPTKTYQPRRGFPQHPDLDKRRHG
jgi:hypothetical protein